MAITTTPSGGPQGEFSTYTPIYSTTISSAVSSVTLSNIPTTYTDLTISLEVQLASSGEDLYVRFNGDSGSNYSSTWLRGISNVASSLRQSSTGCRLSDGGSSTTGYTTQQTIHIQNYSNATTYKTILSRSNNASRGLDAFVNLWRSTSPITSLNFYTSAGNISSGTITVYGIKAAAPAPKATGGDYVYTDNTYWYHIFNNSGLFDVKTSMNVDYLVVAGGGGGGSEEGGGGGGGGYRTATTQAVTPVAYTVTVGAGGVGGVASGTRGTSGGNSTFNSFSATGGGGGGTNTSKTGLSGGSGGGSGNAGAGTGGSGNAGSYTPVEGYAGGTNTPYRNGSGGGGAAGVGTAPTSATDAGNGGSGATSSYSGFSVVYAGGGGGGKQYASNSGGTGGAGGGGNGGGSSAAVAGTTNLGGGGGGGAAGGIGAGPTAANGGSGIVIVRYAL